MKKIIAAILILTTIFCLAACNSNQGNSTSNYSSSNVQDTSKDNTVMTDNSTTDTTSNNKGNSKGDNKDPVEDKDESKTQSSSSKNNDVSNGSQNQSQTSNNSQSSTNSTTQNQGTVHAHIFDQKVTTANFLKSKATCQSIAAYYYSCTCGTKGTATFSYGQKLAHTYNQKNTDIKYQKSKATTSSPAVYYYSCCCGEKGSSTFTYGTVASGWQQENKKVYCIRNVSLHTTTDDNKNYCENVSVGRTLNVIATNGTWYEVEYPYLSQGFAYIMCKYVTDNKDEATFINYSAENIKSSVVLDGIKGVYLCKDLSEEGSSQIGYITYAQSHKYSFYIEGINQKGNWVKVRYCGYDSENRYYDGTKLYYCKRNNLWIFD